VTGRGPLEDDANRDGDPIDPVPPPGPATTRARFGELLTELRRRSGRTLRDLAGEIGSSASTLSGWLRAERLPFPSQQPVFAELLSALGVTDLDPWLDTLARLRDEGLRRRDEQPPYRGLESFQRADADRFFGRDVLVARLRALVRELADGRGPRLLLVVGASGAGKSSVLHAGLLATLEEVGTSVAALTPGSDPMARLAAAVGRTAASLGDAPATAPEHETEDAEPTPAVVVVDQVEELFTTCDDPDERDRFLAALEALGTPADAPTTGAVVVLGLRSDFYPELVRAGRLTAAVEAGQVVVGPMSADELERAIVEPAARAGWSVDDDLIGLLRHDFLPRSSTDGAYDPGALPLLSHALLETWRGASRKRLTVADYLATGGIDGAVERSAEQVHDELGPDEQRLARRLFLRLVHLGDATVPTRRPLPFGELDDLDDPGDGQEAAHSARSVASRFVDARLLTADDVSIRISHDALLGAWARLGGWVEDSREDLLVQRRITEAARLWDDGDRDPSLLASGARLAALRAWVDARPEHLPLTATERAFVAASSAQADAAAEEERRRSRRLRLLVAATSVLAVLAAGLAAVAGWSRSEAIEARDDAESRQLALLAERVAESDPSLAAQLAVTSYDVATTSEARSALLELAAAPRAARSVGAEGGFTLAVAPSGGLVAASDPASPAVLVSHLPHGRHGTIELASTLPLSDTTAEVRAMRFIHGGTVLVVGTDRGEVELWDLATPDAPERLGILPEGSGGVILALRTDLAGTTLLAAGTVGGVLRWDLTDPAAPVTLPPLPYDPAIHGLAAHPDGRHVVVGDEAGSVTIWALDGADEPVATVLEAPDDLVWSVDLAPDGSRLAVGLRSGRARVWDTSTLTEPEELVLDADGFDSWVNAVAFSGNGRYLAAGSSGNTVRLWATDTWQAVRSLPHPTPVSGVGFTEDGGAVVSAATDGVTRVWSLYTALPVGLPAGIWSIEPSEDGTRLLASSGAGGAIWDVPDPTGRPRSVAALAPREDGPLLSGAAAMRADGHLVASGTREGPVLLHEVADDGAARLLEEELTGPPGLVDTLAFGPDGRYLAGGGGDGAVHVWDLDTPEEPVAVARFEAVGGVVNRVVWSPRQPLLAAGGSEAGARLFDLADPSSPRSLGELDPSGGDVYGIAFAPDGEEVAVAGTSGTVRRFDLTDPAAPRAVATLAGPVGRIMDLAYRPDGEAIAAAVADGTTWVWDLTGSTTPERWATFRRSGTAMFSVAYHPSGDLLWASGADGELRGYLTDPEVARERLCAGIGTPITEVEWPRYLLDRHYEPPC
jgi:WD40 repeat protein/transcriptional regulator with XRE-family HTH domain